MTITIHYSEMCGYSVEVNGEVILECLSMEEVEALTMKELTDLYKEYCED